MRSGLNLRINGLRLADMVMEGTFFLLQLYLTDVFKLNFTTAAAILNIWGGIYRILPTFFLFLADAFLGHFLTLALSGIFSTTGLVLITASALPVYRCHEKEKGECSGDKERAMFITGMALVALGRSARFASANPFMNHQQIEHGEDGKQFLVLSPIFGFVLFLLTAAVVNVAFPYAKKWYLLFGVSAIYTASATVFFLSGYRVYNVVEPEGSPMTSIFRVFVAAAFNICQPSPQINDPRLYVVQDEGTEKLSKSFLLRFLHKAAIQVPDEEPRKSYWTLCSVSELESTKNVIRMVPFWSCFIMCRVVSSTGNTYFVEQISHMEYKIGAWEPPAQLLLAMFLLSSMFLGESRFGRVMNHHATNSYGIIGGASIVFSILCCTAAAAVERRRLHVGARHHLLDHPDAKIPMNAGWLFFQGSFLSIQEGCFVYALTKFFKKMSPPSMEELQNCIIEGVTGVGFLCSVLVVHVVGKISERGGGETWFQATLNMSRLDRYYWVLAALSSVNLLVYAFVWMCYTNRKWYDARGDEAGEPTVAEADA